METVQKEKRTFPLPADAPLKTKIGLLIAPMFFMLAISFPNFAKNNLSTVICEEANSTQHYALIVLIATLCGSIVSPIVGRLGDIFGRKRIALFCLIPFIASLFVIGTANGPVLLGIGYAFLGIFYTSLSAVTNGMIIDLFDQATRTKFLAFTNSANAIASMLGPKLVGVIANNIGAQRAMMSLTILLGAAWLLIFFTQPDIRNLGAKPKIDMKGLVLLPLAVGPVLVALTTGGKQIPWTSPWIWVMIACSVVFSVIFYKVEKKEELPMVNFTMLSNKIVLPALFFCFLLNSTGGLATYMNLYCRNILEFTPSDLGSLQFFAWMPAVLVPLVGIYLSKTNNFKLAFSVSAILHIIAPLCFVIFLKRGISPFAVAATKIPQFLTACLVLAPMNAYLGAFLSPKERGMGLALIAFFSTLGTTIFTAVFALCYNLFPEGSLERAFHFMCYVTAGVGLVRLLIALTTIKKIEKDQKPIA